MRLQRKRDEARETRLKEAVERVHAFSPVQLELKQTVRVVFVSLHGRVDGVVRSAREHAKHADGAIPPATPFVLGLVVLLKGLVQLVNESELGISRLRLVLRVIVS